MAWSSNTLDPLHLEGKLERSSFEIHDFSISELVWFGIRWDFRGKRENSKVVARS